MAELVRITDVSPRDGLQNEPGIIPTDRKVELVRLLCETGVDEVEVSSFVSAKWVPQLGDAEDVILGLLRSPSLREGLGVGSDIPSTNVPARSAVLSALVPNERGMQGVLDANRRAGRRVIGKVSVFTAASETFSMRNTNATIAQTLERFVPVIAAAKTQGLAVRGYISCAFACPFEGPIAPGAVASVGRRLMDLGVDEIDYGDTIGAATPERTRDLLDTCRKEVPIEGGRLLSTVHLHDTFGLAADCVKAALDMGVRSFDGSVAGLGGCPYASTPGKRAPGNISTELLVQTVENAGFTTGVDKGKLARAADFARKIVAASRGGAA